MINNISRMSLQLNKILRYWIKNDKYQNDARTVQRSKFKFRTKSSPRSPLSLARVWRLRVGARRRESAPAPTLGGRYVELSQSSRPSSENRVYLFLHRLLVSFVRKLVPMFLAHSLSLSVNVLLIISMFFLIYILFLEFSKCCYVY